MFTRRCLTFMKNIIKCNIQSTGPFEVIHNGLHVPYSDEIIVECVYGKNELVIKGNVLVESITMFDSSNLAHLLQIEDECKLSYEYPVFSWIHKNLNYGWLIKNDK
jgi:hypothetical protein